MLATKFSDPSDLLVALIGWLRETGPRTLTDDFDEKFDETSCSAAEIVAAVRPLLPAGDAHYANPTEVTAVVRAVQAIDRWHAEALPGRIPVSPSDDQRHLADRLADTGRFNTTATEGFLIPVGDEKRGRPLAEPVEHEDRVVWDLLSHTCWIPPHIALLDKDRQCHPVFGSSSEQVRVAYHRVATMAAASQTLLDPEAWTIMFAPLAQASADVTAWYCQDTHAKYAMHPAYSRDRVLNAVEAAIEKGATLLCLPEMTVAEDWLDDLPSLITTLRKRWAMEHDDPPALRYIMAGCVSAERDGFEPHRNFIVMLDAHGKEIFRQDKLSHWDLRATDISRFGLDVRRTQGDAKAPPLVPPVVEDIRFGQEICVVDIDGIGRAVALICADMMNDRPGDWLLSNVSVDLLYAPIMDGSTCQTQDGEIWVMRRGRRAALTGACRVIVANSMTMTCWNQDVFDAQKRAGATCSHRDYTTCGVGMLVDGRASPLREYSVEVALRDVALQTPVARWSQLV